MTMTTRHLYTNQPIALENGEQLPELTIRYTTYGELNSTASNVVWVCHALTADTHVLEWWSGLFGEGDLFDPKDYFIICVNALGSPYGSTSPLNHHPLTNTPYFLDFPAITIRDMAKVHGLVAKHLGIASVAYLIGGSLGGQQALEIALGNEFHIERLILLATNAQHSPWGIAFNETQRQAIENDPSFSLCLANGGHQGLQTARTIALLSYRTPEIYNRAQEEKDDAKTDHYKASSYQRYQGQKLANRFNAYSYWYLTKAMDSHHIGRGRKSVEDALKKITAETLVIGIESDLLFPIEEQHRLANGIPNAQLAIVPSAYGHDGFLVETKKLQHIIGRFLEGKLVVRC